MCVPCNTVTVNKQSSEITVTFSLVLGDTLRPVTSVSVIARSVLGYPILRFILQSQIKVVHNRKCFCQLTLWGTHSLSLEFNNINY